MKSTKKTARSFRLINLHPNLEKRRLEPAKEHDFKKLNDLVFSEYKKNFKFAGPYLHLSAARTKMKDKGFINAINCRNIFPDGPNIDFVPQESFGGKIELWMQNISKGDSFSIQFRVICGNNGQWEVRSSDAAPFQTPIVPVSQSIDAFIPPVESDYGQILVTLEAMFSNGGSWVFTDVIVKKIEF